jgi:hypothetical protein
LGGQLPKASKNLKLNPKHAFAALFNAMRWLALFPAGLAFFVSFSGGVADF